MSRLSYEENVQFDSTNRDSAPSSPSRPDRLTGWKDVAGYVGKSVRTAQRWEKTVNLPVHRITTPNGEVVYSFRTELDEWARTRLQKVSETENSGGRAIWVAGHRLWLLGLAAGVTVAGLLVAVFLFASPFVGRTPPGLRIASGGGRGAPVGWRVEDGRLKIYDGRDDRLWEYAFPFDLDERAYARRDSSGSSLVAIADLENDGRKEVLFIARGRDPDDSALFCFDANGAVRFSVQPRRRVRFGTQDYAPPFEVRQIFLTQEPDRRATLWLVARHHAWFPSVLQKLTHTGDVVAEYWNDGRVDSVREAVLGSHRVILAAGTNIEYAGPSLAVLDYDAPAGAAPADDPRFQCTSCASNPPLAAFVVPFTSLWSEINLAPGVDDILLSKNGYFTLALHGNRITDGAGRRLDVLATFDQGFDVVDVQTTGVADAASLRTSTTAAAGREARLQMFPVLRWLDGRRMPSRSP